MMLSSYDKKSGDLFTWDREFKYAGRVTSPPGDSLIVQEELRCQFCLIGAFFWSGSAQGTAVIWSDGQNEYKANVFVGGPYLCFHLNQVSIGLIDRIVLCGPIVKQPEFLSRFCSNFPSNPIYVCPLGDELAAFGCLAEKLIKEKLDYPRRANLFVPNSDPLEANGEEYEPTLSGDGYGRMAFAVAHGAIAVNQMMSGPGISAFHGRMLSAKPVFPNPVYIINPECIDKFLPMTPVSLKVFAATSVPVLAKVSDEFRKATGHTADEAVVFVASDFVEGLGTFMQFYGAMTKRGIVVSGWLSSQMSENLSLFRYNKYYLNLTLQNLGIIYP